jgi:hypothetical protein
VRTDKSRRVGLTACSALKTRHDIHVRDDGRDRPQKAMKMVPAGAIDAGAEIDKYRVA